MQAGRSFNKMVGFVKLDEVQDSLDGLDPATLARRRTADRAKIRAKKIDALTKRVGIPLVPVSDQTLAK